MTTDSEINLRAGRRHVARSRGALSGILLVILGAWAALVPFIGPYFNLGFEPRPNDAWHWTSGRGWFEVLPGAVAVAGGLLLLLSSSRLMTLVGSWIAALAGVWLVIGTSLAQVLTINPGGPDRSLRPGLVALEVLLYFFATGAAIVLVAGIALGRLSVHSVRDVRTAEHRAELQAAEEQRIERERRTAAEAAAAAEYERENERRRIAAANEQPEDNKRSDGGNSDAGSTGGTDGIHAPGEHDPEQTRTAADSESYPGHSAGTGERQPVPHRNDPRTNSQRPAEQYDPRQGHPPAYQQLQSPPVPQDPASGAPLAPPSGYPQQQPQYDPRQAPPPAEQR